MLSKCVTTVNADFWSHVLEEITWFVITEEESSTLIDTEVPVVVVVRFCLIFFCVLTISVTRNGNWQK